MNTNEYLDIEKYMHQYMNDGAHDTNHVYRVLYTALLIAKNYKVDIDVLIAASLLHDIGREDQFRDKRIDHAIIGAQKAYEYLKKIGWEEERASHVKDCISTHRFRKESEPETIEAKILFDADKIDVSGAIGIARTLAYKGIVGEPLYYVDSTGDVSSGSNTNEISFFQEYVFKLSKLYNRFYTKEAEEIGLTRKNISVDFYNSILKEVGSIHKLGMQELQNALM